MFAKHVLSANNRFEMSVRCVLEKVNLVIVDARSVYISAVKAEQTVNVLHDKGLRTMQLNLLIVYANRSARLIY